MNSKTTLITSEKNWMESNAVAQLNALERLDDVVRVVGLPDLHAGRSPVGFALTTRDKVYPHLISNDIGCGMSLYATGIERRKAKLDKWVKRLSKVRLADIEATSTYDEPSPISNLGTLGGGNHFAELHFVHEVFNVCEFERLGLEKKAVHMLIHSGSRGYGQQILEEFSGIGYTGAEAQAYIKKHNDTLLWASRNRDVVASKLLRYLGYTQEPQKVIGCTHNFLEQREGLYIHRKGAVSTEVGAVVIPGSRGSLTYIVKPTDDTAKSVYSLSHGAGRKWARGFVKSRIWGKYDMITIRQNKYKGVVVCHDKDLLFDEAAEAYKNIDTVVQCLVDHGLAEVIATLKPMLTYKG